MSGSRFLTPKQPESTERALAAVAAFPTVTEAREYLKGEGYTTTDLQLENLRKSKHERFEEVRKELAPAIEQHLAGDARDNAHLCAELEKVMLKQLLVLAREGRISGKDLARSIRDTAQTKAQNVEKMMTLEERPQHIIDRRTSDELIRGLESLGVAKQVNPAEEVIRVVKQIEPGEQNQ